MRISIRRRPTSCSTSSSRRAPWANSMKASSPASSGGSSGASSRSQLDRPFPTSTSMDVVVPALGRPGGIDPELRLADEVEEFGDLGDFAEVLLDPIQGRRDRSALAVEDPEGLPEG